MIALYIIGGILLLLAVVAFLPVKVFFTTEDGKRLTVRFLFFKWGILPIEKKKSGKKSSDKKPKSEGKRIVGKNGAFKDFGELFAVAKVLFKKVFWIAKKIRIHHLEALVVVAEGDAAETAIQYGKVCAYVYPAFGMLGSFTDISNAKVEVRSDFDSDDSSFYFEAEIGVRLFFAVVAAASVLWQFVKIKLSDMGGNNKERKK